MEDKYTNVIKLIINMIDNLIHSRPDCELILNDKSLWALDITNIENDLKRLLIDDKAINDIIIVYFIQKLIKSLNGEIS